MVSVEKEIASINKSSAAVTLCNSSDSLPETFYIFTNMGDWLTKHNLDFTKGFTSGSIGEIAANPELMKKYIDGTLDYMPYVPNANVDVHGLSKYQANSTSEYRIEYNCELYRRYHDETKLFPSRMSCLFAFGDFESCKQVSKIHGWDLESVREYNLLKLPLTRIAKVNMEVISLFRYAERNGSWTPDEQEKIWQHYWSGRGNLELDLTTDGKNRKIESSGVIWEYLIEGRVELKV